MGVAKVNDIKNDKYQLVRLNRLLTYFLQMISEVDRKLQSKDTEIKEWVTLEKDRAFFLSEYCHIKEELCVMLHDLGLDRGGDWIFWKGKIRRGVKVISGGSATTKRNNVCLRLV